MTGAPTRAKPVQAIGRVLRRWTRLSLKAKFRLGIKVAIVWKGRIPVRTPGKKDKPLR
jgi:hypothetical protein